MLMKRRRMRRNPKAVKLRTLQDEILIPGAAMAAGAVGVDLIYGALPVPANLKTGIAGTATKAAVAIAAGMLSASVLGKKLGASVALGGVVTLIYSMLKPQLQAMFPQLPLGAYLSEYSADTVRTIAPYARPGLGYMNAGQFVGSKAIMPYSSGQSDTMGAYLSGDYSGMYGHA